MNFGKLVQLSERMADPDIFTWLNRPEAPSHEDVYRAATNRRRSSLWVSH